MAAAFDKQKYLLRDDIHRRIDQSISRDDFTENVQKQVFLMAWNSYRHTNPLSECHMMT